MSSPVAPAPAELAELTQLHRETRYLDAYRLAQTFAPCELWAGTEGLVLAGRLVSCWGDWPRSNRLHRQAWQRDPHHPDAIYFQAITSEQKHGPFEALRFLHEQRVHLEVANPRRAHAMVWLLQARLLSQFRDFDAASPLLDRTKEHLAEDPWWWTEQALILEKQDRYAHALVAAEKALEMGPVYRPAIEVYAHLLMLQSRDEEALALLRDRARRLQSGSLAQMLAVLLKEQEQHDEALVALDRTIDLLPEADHRQKAWLNARRAELLCRLGRREEAAGHARLVQSPFHDRLAARLSTPKAHGKRVLMRVGFVRQHHLTCAPATLTAIGNFWGRAVDHAELAQTICYDGTPDHEERYWAEQNGWAVREFRVTWDFARTLLDRGCPFTLTTVYPRSAHLQAVVGYDDDLGLLLIRDPYERTYGEFAADKFFESSAAHGPRGMVLVPQEQSALLEGLEFPEAEAYDLWYTLRRELVRHDRAAAQSAATTLDLRFPGSRFALMAQRELAFYDGNLLRQLEVTRSQLGLFPKDTNLLLDEIQYLQVLGLRQELPARFEAARHQLRKEPLFWREWVEEMMHDARQQPRIERWLRLLLRHRPIDANNLRACANFLWAQLRFVEATEVYRLAACVGDKVESHWDSLFAASRHVRTSDTCLGLLQKRAERLGLQSGQPARTLFRAYEVLDREPEGFALLAAALARRPDDGELMLFAAHNHGRVGRVEESQRLLAAAADRTPRPIWLRTAARLAGFRCAHQEALDHWRELLILNPVDADACAATVRLMATVESRAAAVAFLAETCARFPNHVPLQHQLIEWLRPTPPAALAVVARSLELDAGNSWALREKALLLRRLGRFDEALEFALDAKRREPHNAASDGVLAIVLRELRRTVEARAAVRDALRRSLHETWMNELLASCESFEDRAAAVEFIRTEILRQASPEDAPLHFRVVARAVLPPDRLRQALEEILAAHPDNWTAWSALGTHLLEIGEITAARQRAQDATARFPLLPRVWFDLAAVQTRARRNEEIESLRRALELSPSWGQASRALADAHERALQLEQAEHVLRRALAADPLDAGNHGHLADLLHRRDRSEEALQLVERAVTLEPAYDWAWARLDTWSRALGKSERAIQLAETLTQQRSGDSRAWLQLAKLQEQNLELELTTLQRAIEIDPRNVDAHDERARVLGQAGQYEAALSACQPAVFGHEIPRELLGRAAWIEFTRGHVTAATKQMLEVVKVHPDYTWGWICVTEWAWKTDAVEQTLEAAKKWSWLSPSAPVPLGFIAAAQLRLKNRREAKDALWRALQVDPAYGYGARNLLSLLADDCEMEEAARVLEHIKIHLSPAESQRAAILYHVMGKNQVAAASALAELALVKEAQTFLLDEGVQALREAGWLEVLEKALTPLLTDPAANPDVGRHWAEVCPPARRWRKLRQLPKQGASEVMQRTAWGAAIASLGKTRATWRLRWLRYTRRQWLRSHPQLWGAVGYALVTLGEFRAAFSWLQDWRQHTPLQPWMLQNFVLSCYRRKKPAPAQAAIEHALTLPADHTRNGFLSWRAFEQALRGEVAKANESLAQVTSGLNHHTALVRDLATILVTFETSPAPQRRNALKLAKQQLAKKWESHPSAGADGTLRYYRARTLRRLGKASGSWLTQAQSWLPPSGFEIHFKSGLSPSAWLVAFLVLGAFLRSCAH